MATIYGDRKAGQFAKRTAGRYLNRMMYWSLGGSCICGVVLGFIVTTGLGEFFGLFRWAAEHAWIFVVIAAGLAAVSLWALNRLDIYTEKLAIRRIGWLRGGEGEALVAWWLNRLPNSWYVFHNVHILRKCDLDHVIIGPGGFFCISTKTHRGTYSVRPDGTYLLNGDETDEIHEAQRLALVLRDRLEQNKCSVRWIQPVLIAPLSYIDFHSFQNRAWVLHQDNLNDVFLDGPTKLQAVDIDRYANAVRNIVHDGPT